MANIFLRIAVINPCSDPFILTMACHLDHPCFVGHQGSYNLRNRRAEWSSYDSPAAGMGRSPAHPDLGGLGKVTALGYSTTAEPPRIEQDSCPRPLPAIDFHEVRVLPRSSITVARSHGPLQCGEATAGSPRRR